MAALSACSLAAIAIASAAMASAEIQASSPTADLDPERKWLVGGISIEGNEEIATSALRRVIETRPRNRFTFWRDRPTFDVSVFEDDLGRILRFYESEGYFKARVEWRVESRRSEESEILALVVLVTEGPRAVVTSIEIDPPEDALTGAPARTADDEAIDPTTTIRPEWALEVGSPFREVDYQRFEAQLRALHLDRSHAAVTTKRMARVRPDKEGVAIRYEITPGPPARFGPITIEGLEKVERRLIERELTFEPGDPFSLSRIEESRRRLQLLDLFASIQVEWTTDPARNDEAAISIRLREKKPRELRIGAGYSTEERARGHVRWQHRNWLGGGRRLLLSGRYSNLVRAAGISFAQPHVGNRDNRALFEFSLFQQDEPNFTRNSVQGVPAFEHTFTPRLVLTTGLRVETAEVRDVEPEVKERIGGVRDEGTLIGPRVHLQWNRVDAIARPRNGFVVSVDGEYSTRLVGATYDYFRLVGEVSVFKSIFDYAVVAGRLKAGAAQAFGDKERLPIFERFYAGGEGSVRGYRRHQLGPTANNGNPLGGRSLIEGSIETRIPVWREIGAVAFFDFAQVSLDRYDFVPDDLRYAAGPGISYSTPIGPISLFAGFPINRQAGEPPWQIHFNIGFFF